MTERKLQRNRRGFTLTEVLLALAILIILLALAMIPISRHQRNIRQTELDSKAETIYLAAQNRLSQLQATPPSGRRVFLLKDVRLFLNSLDRGLRLVREAGIGAESRREDTEDAILLTIRIPKNRQVS